MNLQLEQAQQTFMERLKDLINITPYDPFKLRNKYYIPIKEKTEGWEVIEITPEICWALVEGTTKIKPIPQVLSWDDLLGLLEPGCDPY